MRIIALAILASATSFIVPAQAQTYDPSYPVCLKVYGSGRGGGEYNECRYTSLAQCNASASGRAATCMINPWYAHAPPSRRPYRRHPRQY
jgi:Protein of unknown function (DUF3551)